MGQLPAIEEIFHQYGSKVYTLALRLSGNHEDAQDITQETFLNAHKYLDKFRNESNVYTWLYRITVNNGLKHKKRYDNNFFIILPGAVEEYKEQVPAEVTDWESDPEKHYLFEELIAEVRLICYNFMTFRLTDEQRVVYVLRNNMKLSIRDIAHVLEIDENTVKARLHRAKNNLVKYFKSQCCYFNSSANHSCRSRIGFALQYFPQIIDNVKNRAEDKKTKELISETLKQVKDIDEVYRLSPEADIPVDSGELLRKK